MLMLGDIELLGRETTLRSLSLDDAPALADASSESREHYRFNPVPDGFDATVAYIERALAQKAAGQRHPFTILWRGRIVGTTSYSEFQPWPWPPGAERAARHRPDSVEIGYTWLAASAQHTSCNTEAKYLLLAHAFETWAVHGVSFRTDERNQRSRAAIERLGAVFEGIRRAHMPGVDGTVRSSAFYSIVAAEWPAVKERLLSRLNRTPS
jgi:RimJ/RimL family protein N-acetyltransferase